MMVCFVNHNGLTLSFGKKLKEQYLLRMRLTANDNIGYKSLFHIVFLIICFIGVGKVSLLPFLCCSLTFALLVLSSQFFRNLLKPLINMMRIPHLSKYSSQLLLTPSSNPSANLLAIPSTHVQSSSLLTISSAPIQGQATIIRCPNYCKCLLTSLPASSLPSDGLFSIEPSHCSPSQMEVRTCPPGSKPARGVSSHSE